MSKKTIIHEQHSRFRGLPWYPIEEVLIIGGVGGIGSPLLVNAARAGVEVLFFYDDDIVERANLSGQAFNKHHVDMPKVEAVAKICQDYDTTSLLMPMNKKYDEHGRYGRFMASAFDNIESREIMFNNWVRYVEENPEDEYPLFFDGRLEAQTFQSFFVTKDRIEDYRKTLFKKGESGSLVCTTKQTSHVAQILAGTMFGIFTNHIANMKLEETLFRVPFRIDQLVPNYSVMIE